MAVGTSSGTKLKVGSSTPKTVGHLSSISGIYYRYETF